MANSKAESSIVARNWVPYYTGAISAIGFSLLLLAWIYLPADHQGLLIFAGMAALAELLSVELFFRSRNSTVSVSGIVAVASVIALGPLAGVWVHLVTGLASVVRTSLIHRSSHQNRASWLQRFTFNTGMWMIASAAAGAVYVGAGGTIGPVVWRTDLLPLVLMAFVDIAVNLILLIGVIALQTGQRPLSIWRSEFQWTVPITLLGSVLGGGILAAAYDMLGLMGIVISYLPIITTGYSFQLYTSRIRSYVEELETLNAQMEQANEQLRRADEFKDGLLRNVTHELKTPLAILSGYMEILRMESDNLAPEQQEIMEIASSQTERLNEIVRQVIAIHQSARAGEDRKELNLVEVASAALHDAEQASDASAEKARPQFQFSFHAAAPTLVIQGNCSYLKRAFNEVLKNAVKFSPNGGEIHMEIKPSSEPLPSTVCPKIPGAAATLDQWIVTTISDTGVGIPAEEVEKVWQRFYQADMTATRRFNGTGLGLAIVKETVEAHDGVAWIESCVGRGTTVFIALPAC